VDQRGKSQVQSENTLMSENENTMPQNLWNTAKTVPRGKFIALNVYIRKDRVLSQLSKLLPQASQIKT
jgi:hypothetical protein